MYFMVYVWHDYKQMTSEIAELDFTRFNENESMIRFTLIV